MEPEAIRDHLEQLHDRAFGWAMICCDRDRDLAADVLQQAYCRILNGDATFRSESGFSTWVFGVVRNVAFEETRRRRRDNVLPVEDADVMDPVPAGLEQRELSEYLWAALQRLSPRQREVLHLTFYQDLSLEQAADVLEISVGSARQHYHRGKASLRRVLATSQEFDGEHRR